MKKIITKSKEETQKFAENLANNLLAKSGLASDAGALIIGLFGNLGAGKTTFTQGFAKGLGIKQKIISPTFVILKRFKIMNKSQKINSTPLENLNYFLNKNKTLNKLQRLELKKKTNQNFLTGSEFKIFIHIDAYRLENPDELLNLGWRELINNPENIILVEWANKIKKIMPKNYIKINFTPLENQKKLLNRNRILIKINGLN